jgi:hypothetical protein
MEKGHTVKYNTIWETFFTMATLMLFLTFFSVDGHCDYITDDNVYLGSIFEWNPQKAGDSRTNWAGITDENNMPIQNNRAIGAPTGNGVGSRVYDSTAVGINGSAAWKFEEGYYIFNGEGNDFKTFEGSFAWSWEGVDGLCCELGHIQFSEDGENWYYNSSKSYTENPNPSAGNSDYSYFDVDGLHGNNPTWANYTKDMQAMQIEEVNGMYTWVKIPDTVVSKDFNPNDPYLGGNDFDLSDFRSVDDDLPWPELGKMYYIRLIDDDTILDGQDYAKSWCFGAQMHAAMGLNTMKETSSVPIPSTLCLLGFGLSGVLGYSRRS